MVWDMLNKPIWALTASELCKKTKNNELSATEITVACLEQTKKVNPQLNAIVDDMSDEAIKRAESLDSEVAAGKPKGRLFGVPVTVKINVDQKGYATSNGVTALKNLIAKTNAPIVDHLMDAGAVLLVELILQNFLSELIQKTLYTDERIILGASICPQVALLVAPVLQ